MNSTVSHMQITILGCGTSTGVPMIACDCPVCRSDDGRNKRTRSSILISKGEMNVLTNVLIDTSTDLRYQSLKNNVRHIDAVFFTHCHADHVHGIDELRSFNFVQKKSIPCYGDTNTLDSIKRMFSYIFGGNCSGGGIPQITLNRLSEEKNVQIGGISFTPISVIHGKLPILGYRFNRVAYVTDCSEIPAPSMDKLQGLDTLILGALRHRPHNTHFNIEEALNIVARLKPKRTFFTHLSHDVDYEKTSLELPEGVSLAYDGLIIEV